MSEGWSYFLDFNDQALELGSGELTVGRSRTCDVSVNDPSVSRRHVVLRVDNGQVFLRDLGSSNGTFINGQRVEGDGVLNHGDTLGLGDADLKVRVEGLGGSAFETMRMPAQPATPEHGDATLFLQQASAKLANEAMDHGPEPPAATPHMAPPPTASHMAPAPLQSGVHPAEAAAPSPAPPAAAAPVTQHLPAQDIPPQAPPPVSGDSSHHMAPPPVQPAAPAPPAVAHPPSFGSPPAADPAPPVRPSAASPPSPAAPAPAAPAPAAPAPAAPTSFEPPVTQAAPPTPPAAQLTPPPVQPEAPPVPAAVTPSPEVPPLQAAAPQPPLPPAPSPPVAASPPVTPAATPTPPPVTTPSPASPSATPPAATPASSGEAVAAQSSVLENTTGDLLPSLDGFDSTMGPEMLEALRLESQNRPEEEEAPAPAFNPYSAPSASQPTAVAGFGIRLAATLVDWVWMAGLGVAAYFFGSGFNHLMVSSAASVISLLVVLFGWAIWGATPGKAVFHLQVSTGAGGQAGIGFPRAVARLVGYVLSGVLLGAGFLMIAFSKSRQGLHDRIAGTYVHRAN